MVEKQPVLISTLVLQSSVLRLVSFTQVTDTASYFPEGATINSASTDASFSDSDHGGRPTSILQDINQVYSFPRLLTVQHCSGRAESYCRSLFMEKHGFPLRNPIVALKEGSVYLEKGISIGDVGFINPGGSFQFFFNIFKAIDDPIHAGLTPAEFTPIELPLDDSEITFISDYFKPGTIIASDGIKVIKHRTEPL